MCGIYIHIPFCKEACFYCNFHFSTSKKNKDAYVQALLKEIILKKDTFSQSEINTIYFGGGTPTQLSAYSINQITDALYKNYSFAPSIEFTIEANPDDLNAENLIAFKDLGVNRLSIGIQSFNAADLKYLNRTHNAAMAEYAIKEAQDNGFSNINIDLIYGIPTLTQKSWQHNLNKFINLGLPHLSSYCLTVEPRTPLAVLIKKHKLKPLDETRSINHYKMLTGFMKDNGFLHYEISNFCKEHFYSKHNLSYWQQKPYLGFGASAHSYNEVSRSWNIANTTQYIKNINNNILFFETEQLNATTKYNEYILTSLRTMWGCNLDYIKNKFGNNFYNYATEQLSQYIQCQYVIQKDNIIYLSEEGKLFADKIASDLFIV